MKIIYKYQLHIIPVQKVMLPVNSKILHIDVQDEIPCLWVQFTEGAVLKEKKIYMIVTGVSFELTDDMRYVGTFMLDSQTLVFHIYENV